MKRISCQTLYKTPQSMIHGEYFQSVVPKKQETETQFHETVLNTTPKTESQGIFKISHHFFADCFPTIQKTEPLQKSYHKLQSKSLGKKSIKQKQSQTGQKKTFSLRNSIDSLDKENTEEQGLKSIFKNINENNVPTHDRNQKYNGFSICRNQPMHSALRTQLNKDTIQDFSIQDQKLFLSQNLRAFSTFDSQLKEQNKKIRTQRKLSSQLSDYDLGSIYLKKQYEKSQQMLKNGQRLSTIDSYKMRENLQTENSQTMTPLDMNSKLCESVNVKDQFQFDCLKVSDRRNEQSEIKGSFIEKLDLFNKEEILSSRRKSFLRSTKHINHIEQSPKFYEDENIKTKTEASDENMLNYKSGQTVQQKVLNRNRFKRLDQCAYTIVSKYNKSSDKKSVLQESNIVFQASKMCDDFKNPTQKLMTFSDTSIRFEREQQKENQMNYFKPYSSFVHEMKLDESKCEEKVNNRKEDNFLERKLRGGFLRKKNDSENKTQVFQSQKDEKIKSFKSSSLSIRFDLDTFIEYGPL